jgi:hypothetical protein
MSFAWRRREALWEEEEVVVVVFAGLASVCFAVEEDLLKARSHEKIT